MVKKSVALAIVALLPIPGFSQQSPQNPNSPNDTGLQVLTQPDGPEATFLEQHPGSVALSHQQGRLNFQNANGSLSAVFGSVSHRDPVTGTWVQNAPILSVTNNGWRLDGSANSLVVRKNGQNHIITQTFTDFDTKHDSVLALTVPVLTYDKNLSFHFTQDV
jgi:hypothetical protein